MAITLNESQRLFVIPCGEGYSCMGFDVVFKQLKALAEKLMSFGMNTGEVRDDQIGTLGQYEQYQRAWAMVGNRDLGTWFDPETPNAVRKILESYRKSGNLIRVFYGDVETGRDWMEENDVVGRVGRSCGRSKIPLLVEEGESGGPGMLDGCIVRICDASTRKEIYVHPHYHVGEMEIRPATCGAPYTHGVWVNGENHANFLSYGKAAQWVAFMIGECMEKPQ